MQFAQRMPLLYFYHQLLHLLLPILWLCNTSCQYRMSLMEYWEEVFLSLYELKDNAAYSTVQTQSAPHSQSIAVNDNVAYRTTTEKAVIAESGINETNRCLAL